MSRRAFGFQLQYIVFFDRWGNETAKIAEKSNGCGTFCGKRLLFWKKTAACQKMGFDRLV